MLFFFIHFAIIIVDNVHTVLTVTSYIIAKKRKEGYTHFGHFTKKKILVKTNKKNSNFSISRNVSFELLSNQHPLFEEGEEGRHPDRWTQAIIDLQTNGDDI